MVGGQRYSKALAVLGLATVAGAVHAEEALRTMAVAAFPDVNATAKAIPQDSPAIEPGADLNSALGSHRSVRRTAPSGSDLLPNPYGASTDDRPSPPPVRFAARLLETYHDDRWADPYPTAQNTYTDESWSNPYGPARDTRSDERWLNPYVTVQDTKNDERWSNPYGAVR
jgi:hypothetical protein